MLFRSRNPEYVKLSFKTAYEVLESYGLQGKVSLLYNDFNMSDLTTRVFSLVNYVNKSDELNPEAKRYCDGVGMQSHLSVQSLPVYQQLATVGYFLEEGFEVQITELDITTNSKDVEEHADYWYTFIKGLIDQKKAGGNITGITLWGLYDAVSWRKEESPLLYDKNMNDPKKSLYAVFAASQTY